MILLLIQLAWCLLAPQPRQVAAGPPTAIYGVVSDFASDTQTGQAPLKPHHIG